MIFAILIVVGLLGVALTLWVTHPKVYSDLSPTGEPWYVLHPENFESGIIEEFRKLFKNILKWILIRLIGLYRSLAEKITVKQILKKRIRAFLYEHRQHDERNPSEFWHKVRKGSPTEQ